MLNIVFMGPPGAGKGTQSKIIEDTFGLKQLSTGAMFRAEIAAGTPLGLQVKSVLDAGSLVSDDITVGIIRARLSQPDCKNGVIFDGFPRTVPQAEALDALFAELGHTLHAVLQLVVDDSILLGRIQERAAQTGEKRADDDPEVLKKRLAAYHSQTAPLLPFYREKGLLHQIDGMQSVETVAAQIARILQAN
jgi:adenylate kinase